MLEAIRLPNERAIGELPHWAQVAFGARCARRVMPLFFSDWPDAPSEIIESLSEQLALTESAAATARVPCYDRRHLIVRNFSWEPAFDEHLVAREVAFAVERALTGSGKEVGGVLGFLMDELTAVQNAAEHFFEEEYGYSTLRREIAEDLTHLLTLSSERSWTDETPVPATVFGPLWPDDTTPDSARHGTRSPLDQLHAEAIELAIVVLRQKKEEIQRSSAEDRAGAETPEGSRVWLGVKALGNAIKWAIQ